MKKSSQLKDHDFEMLFTYFNELNIISQLSSGIFEKKLPKGLSASQFSVLNWFVRVDTEATPGRLSSAFQVTKGAMTNTLKKLKEKQLITVEPDVSSGRRKIVKMTQKGRKVRDSALASINPLLDEFAGAFDVADIRKQTVAIQKVRLYLDEYRYRSS
jgi:DNA-binding MarR family transcriptional regulator